jgi:hypothetical protein
VNELLSGESYAAALDEGKSHAIIWATGDAFALGRDLGAVTRDPPERPADQAQASAAKEEMARLLDGDDLLDASIVGCLFPWSAVPKLPPAGAGAPPTCASATVADAQGPSRSRSGHSARDTLAALWRVRSPLARYDTDELGSERTSSIRLRRSHSGRSWRHLRSEARLRRHSALSGVAMPILGKTFGFVPRNGALPRPTPIPRQA